jgi:3-hydroxymyristoyl/3-hydroxydecanoyl-(acyl carrier protein) dehydratase
MLYHRDKSVWFCQAHFFEDPVMPGSLGLESIVQVLEAEAHAKSPQTASWRVAINSRHNWVYRGQVRKHNKEVRLAMTVKDRQKSSHALTVDSVLYCDGLAIYSLNDLSLEAAPILFEV